MDERVRSTGHGKGVIAGLSIRSRQNPHCGITAPVNDQKIVLKRNYWTVGS